MGDSTLLQVLIYVVSEIGSPSVFFHGGGECDAAAPVDCLMGFPEGGNRNLRGAFSRKYNFSVVSNSILDGRCCNRKLFSCQWQGLQFGAPKSSVSKMGA